MRVELSDYNNRTIKVVGTFKSFGTVKKGKDKHKNKLIIKNLINADTGEYLADHIWVEANNQFNRLDLNKDDVIFFVGKVTRYSKGYKGHNLTRVLNTKAPSNDYTIENIQNVIKKSDCDHHKEHLEKLKKRKAYLLNKKQINNSRKKQVQILIDEIEKEKMKYKDNSILSVHRYRTIEPIFSNKYNRLPLIYSLVDTKRKKSLNFLGKIQNFFKTHTDIIRYYSNEKDIKKLNLELINRYSENRNLNKRLQNIDELIKIIDEFSPSLEKQVNMTKNIIWEMTDDDAYRFEQAKRKVKTKSN